MVTSSKAVCPLAHTATGTPHKGVWLHVLSHDEQLLLVRRAPTMATCAGKWSIIGEHHFTREVDDDCALRALRQELPGLASLHASGGTPNLHASPPSARAGSSSIIHRRRLPPFHAIRRTPPPPPQRRQRCRAARPLPPLSEFLVRVEANARRSTSSRRWPCARARARGERVAFHPGLAPPGASSSTRPASFVRPSPAACLRTLTRVCELRARPAARRCADPAACSRTRTRRPCPSVSTCRV